MALKPWYKVVTPREDLREGRALDASEFAVNLEHVRDGRAPADYKDPKRFFDRTYLTGNLKTLATGVVRRLSGLKVETNAVYNLTTQFGGGKTHALTLLWHLGHGGAAAGSWRGVSSIVDAAEVKGVPPAAVASFVGTEFDSISGRGGTDKTPKRFTPWGEIAFQLGGAKAFDVVAKHDAEGVAPSAEVIRAFLPKDRPSLILMDELLHWVSRNRKRGLSNQFYNFMLALSEEARGQDRVVLAVSLPSLLDEMTPEDHADHDRFEKLLDRLGKALTMSAGEETTELIRRRLFESGGLPAEARRTAAAFAEWIHAHETQIPKWFPADRAQEQFEKAYPFHPALLSVFERKWQQLPRFQQTRGVLRLLALWVSSAYHAGFKGAQKDLLIGMGTAPLHDSLFRSAVFEQLGGAKLEGAVTTDICGKADSHAVRLDEEAIPAIRESRLHTKVATTIFFESNGGQAKAEATPPEIRLSVVEPDLDLGHVETVLEALSTTAYYLTSEKNRYRFSLAPNLNKLLADRRASVNGLDARMRAEVQRVFAAGAAMERVYFPDRTNSVPDRAALTLVVLAPEQSAADKGTRAFVETTTRECGASARTFKSGLVWGVPEPSDVLREETRKLLAWEDIDGDRDDLRLDDAQGRQLDEALGRSRRDVKEAVWRTYKNLWLLGKDGTLRTVDLGLVHSSAAGSMTELFLSRLKGQGDVEDAVSPAFLVRNWPPALREWSTRQLRDAFFAAPQFPRLTNPDALKDTIVRGVEQGLLAWVGKKPDGTYQPFMWRTRLERTDIDFSDDAFVITEATAKAYEASRAAGAGPQKSQEPAASGGATAGLAIGGGTAPVQGAGPAKPPLPPPSGATRIAWAGEIPWQKWSKFYMALVSKFSTSPGLKITVRVEAAPPEGVSEQKVTEVEAALRELGLPPDVEKG